jgi:hypothetical protein
MVKESATLTPKVLQSGGILKPRSCDSLGNQDQVYQRASTLYEIPYCYQEAFLLVSHCDGDSSHSLRKLDSLAKPNQPTQHWTNQQTLTKLEQVSSSSVLPLKVHVHHHQNHQHHLSWNYAYRMVHFPLSSNLSQVSQNFTKVAPKPRESLSCGGQTDASLLHVHNGRVHNPAGLERKPTS